MKDKRNCGSNNYPIYQPPMMVPPVGYPIGYQNMYPQNYGSVTSNTLEQQISNLEQQINMLEQRVNRLEKMNNTNNNFNKYNDSNYYML